MKTRTKRPQVWQTRPSLLEHLRRCDVTVAEWLIRTKVTSEQDMLARCVELGLSAPEWSTISSHVPVVRTDKVLADFKEAVETVVKDAGLLVPSPLESVPDPPVVQTLSDEVEEKRSKKRKRDSDADTGS